MAYSYQTQRYWYCSGTSIAYTDVTMGVNTCPDFEGIQYSDEYCNYETIMKTGGYQYTFSLSVAATEVITVRYSVDWSQTVDYGTPSTGTVTYTCYIPAGVTYYTLAQGTSKSFIYGGTTYTNFPPLYCKEERWCTWGSGGGATPAE